MRLRPASLRFKILIVIVTSVVIAVLTCGLIVRQATARAEDNRMRDNISSQLREASSIYSETGVSRSTQQSMTRRCHRRPRKLLSMVSP